MFPPWKQEVSVRNLVPTAVFTVFLSDIIYELFWITTWAEWLKWKYDSTLPTSLSLSLTHCSGNIWQNNIKTPTAARLKMPLHPVKRALVSSHTIRGRHNLSCTQRWTPFHFPTWAIASDSAFTRRAERAPRLRSAENSGWSLTVHSCLAICIRAS